MAYEIGILLYGRQPVLEALHSKVPVQRILVAHGVHVTGALAAIHAQAKSHGITIKYVPRKELDRAISANHQGVVAEVAPPTYVSLDTILRVAKEGSADAPPLLLLLDCLQDIQNFGALLRTAEAVGVQGVIIPKRRSVSVTPALYKTSAGAVQYLKIARAPNLVRAMETLQKEGFWIVGLDAAGETSYGQVDLRGPIALVVGTEGKGLSRLVRQRCDLRVRLPMKGQVASLNVAVAGSIMLYEVWRQRQQT